MLRCWTNAILAVSKCDVMLSDSRFRGSVPLLCSWEGCIVLPIRPWYPGLTYVIGYWTFGIRTSKLLRCSQDRIWKRYHWYRRLKPFNAFNCPMSSKMKISKFGKFRRSMASDVHEINCLILLCAFGVLCACVISGLVYDPRPISTLHLFIHLFYAFILESAVHVSSVKLCKVQ